MTKHTLEISKPSNTEILLIRKFNAPKALVYDCFTDPDKQRRWLFSGGGNLTVCETDNRVGGAWRWVMELGEHGTHEFFGQNVDITPGERFVRTFIYNLPLIRECVCTETLTLAEADGVTTLNVLIRHLSEQNRDGHLNSGMERGVGLSYDQLEELLTSLNA
ncbi:MAG: SRPBCC domain-containing protein [Fimbriimonadaceae bacterium]